jgi:hypothetical protein
VSMDELEKVQGIPADGISAEGLDDVVLSEEESAGKRLAVGAMSVKLFTLRDNTFKSCRSAVEHAS